MPFAFSSFSSPAYSKGSLVNKYHPLGLPWCPSGNESACQCRRHAFDPWVRKMPWRRKWQHTPSFLPGKSPWTEEPGGLQPTGLQRVTLEHLSTHANISGKNMIGEAGSSDYIRWRHLRLGCPTIHGTKLPP